MGGGASGQSQPISTYAYFFPRGEAWRRLQVSSQAELPHLLFVCVCVDICGLFSSKSLLQVLKCFLRVSTCLSCPLLWLLCWDPKCWGHSGSKVPYAGAGCGPKVLRPPIVPLGRRVSQKTQCFQWEPPQPAVTHPVPYTGPRAAVGTPGRHWPGSCPLLLGQPRATPGLREPCPHPSIPPGTSGPAGPPARRSHVPMSPRGPSTLPRHAGHLLAGGLAALGSRNLSGHPWPLCLSAGAIAHAGRGGQAVVGAVRAQTSDRVRS